jgi:arylsulfatase A-like enzyme
MAARTNAPANVARASESVPHANPVASSTDVRPGPLDLILTAACFGLGTGLLELVLQNCRWFYDPTTRLGDHLVNRHYLWMIPVANVLVFGSCGLMLALAARILPYAVGRLAAYLLWGLASLELLLVLPRLHTLTYLLLACGFASLIAPFFEARTRHVRLNARRVLPWLLGAVAALACFSHGRELLSEHRALTRLPAATPGAPNVLLIVLDTVRADALSLYGYHRDTSPNLVRLARKGVKFEWASATAPWTLPSHASMFTGRWSHEVGVSRYTALGASFPTLAEAFGARGYVTAGFVANPIFCHADYGLARGFVHYEDLPVSPFEVLRSGNLSERLLNVIDVARYKLSELWGEEWLLFRVFGDDPRASLSESHRKNAARINRDAVDWMSAQRLPFFAFLNYYDTHAPYLPPRGAEGRLGPNSFTPSDRATIRNWEAGESMQNSPASIKLARDCYDECIAYLDDQLGRLWNDLDSRGLLENTVVLITADHGEHFGEHAGVFGHMYTLYSQEIRVPLLVIAPVRVPSGQTISAPATLRDLPATIVDLAALGRGSLFPGRSLARFWSPGGAGDPSPADPVFSECDKDWLQSNDSGRFWRSLAIDEMVYIRDASKKEELYNIAADPAEAQDLAGSAGSRSTLEHLRTTLDRFLARNRGPRSASRAESAIAVRQSTPLRSP